MSIWAASSKVERFFDVEKATGPSPVPPTNKNGPNGCFLFK